MERLAVERSYDGDRVRIVLENMGIESCIPGRKNPIVTIKYDVEFYREHDKIENAFAGIKDRRRVTTRYNGCSEMFLSTCALSAIVMFSL